MGREVEQRVEFSILYRQNGGEVVFQNEVKFPLSRRREDVKAKYNMLSFEEEP